MERLTMERDLIIKLSAVRDKEAFVILAVLGLCDGLEAGAISLEDAERFLWTPFTMQRLERVGVRQEVVDLVHWGAELEDVRDLVPGAWQETLRDLRARALSALASLSPRSADDSHRWLDE